MRTVTVGTRGSTLALAQTRWVVARLKEEWPETDFRIQTIVTKGDRDRSRLAEMAAKGDKGFWVKEVEDALLAGRIDLAVHSLKDLPTAQPEGLEIASIPKRVDARDVLIGKEGFGRFEALPQGARVGTSSTRRTAFLRHRLHPVSPSPLPMGRRRMAQAGRERDSQPPRGATRVRQL